MSVLWTNTFLSFRLGPVEEDRWHERVESVLPPPDNWRDRNVRDALVLEALIHPAREWIHYSRNDKLSARVAFPAMTDEFNIKRIAKMVDSLGHENGLGLLHSHKVKPHKPKSENEHGYCSSFMALPKLRSLFDVPSLQQRPDDVIWLRDEYGRRKQLPDTPEVRRMRQDRDAHNALMANTKIELSGYHHDGVKYRIRPDLAVYTANVSGHRIFNESFECGGRIYGLWPQGVPMRDEPIRRNLLINGEPVIELDYNAHHLRILYSWVGEEPPAEPYLVPGFDKKISKMAMFIILNAKTMRGAIMALVDRLGLEWKDAVRLIEELKAANQPIAAFFHTGVGIKLQRADSDVIEDAVSSLVKEEIPCVPVHDSLIVVKRHRNLLHDAMDTAWRKHFPDANCRIDVK